MYHFVIKQRLDVAPTTTFSADTVISPSRICAHQCLELWWRDFRHLSKIYSYQAQGLKMTR